MLPRFLRCDNQSGCGGGRMEEECVALASGTRRDIVLSTNGRGLMMAHIAIATLLESANPRHRMRVSVLVEDVSPEQCDVLRGTANGYPFAEVRVIDALPAMVPYRDVLAPTVRQTRWPLVVWARCFVDVLLPDVQDKILYIDTDVYVADDVGKLLDVPMDGAIFAAAPESVKETSCGPTSRYPRLSLSDEIPFYFNSGVMVFDMSAYRAAGGSRRIVEILKQYGARISAPDQDALNILAQGRVVAIHPRWNYNDGWCERQFRLSLRTGRLYHGRKPHEMLEAMLSPGIIHYKGGSPKKKPTRANHRTERKRYEMMMRRLGYLRTRFLPGTTMAGLLVIWAFDIYHAILLRIARLRLAAWRYGAARLCAGTLFPVVFASMVVVGCLWEMQRVKMSRTAAAVRRVYDLGTNVVPRLILVPDVANMRDIGGWHTADGRRVRYGRLYRSAEFNHRMKWWTLLGNQRVGENTRRYLVDVLGIRTDLDLRRKKKIGSAGVSPLGEKVSLVNIPFKKYGGVDTDEGGAALVTALRVLLDESNYPIVVHCQQGKDRAGTFVAVVEALLGVDEEDVRQDWMLSDYWFAHVDKKNSDSFEAFLQMVNGQPGGTFQEKMVAFVGRHGFSAAEVARVRELLVE